MPVYILKRSALVLPVVLGVCVLVFILVHLIPGDPATVMLGQDASPQEVARLRTAMGLDRPLPVQLGNYLVRLAHGDLGRSIFQNEAVSTLVRKHLPATFELAVAAMLIAILLAIPLGVVSAVRQYSVVDLVSMGFAQIGVSMPVFWLGVLLILNFSLRWNLLPSVGRGAPVLAGLGLLLSRGDPGPLVDGLQHLAMPALTLGLTTAALITRMVRSSMLEVLHQDYVRTARAKGTAERAVIYRHALRNALLPVVTIVGMQFGALLGGAVVTETVFAWPGLGRLAITAIGQRDFPLVQGCVLAVALVFSLLNLAVDVSYALIDPRVRHSMTQQG
ncbi:MAG TPA: ABC transporter permease [Firmicutes bacterium]|nr:ABC transporter permease [Bacillota bacterium]